jgi:hypothetical protein
VRACVRTYVWMPGCVNASLLIQNEMRMRDIIVTSVLVPLAPTTFFRHYVINGTIFEKYLLSVRCVLIFLYSFRLKQFSFQEELGDILSQM